MFSIVRSPSMGSSFNNKQPQQQQSQQQQSQPQQSQPQKQNMGILDTIFQIESSGGTDPARLKPNSEGALGSYQLKPGAIEDLQRVYSSKYGGKTFEEIALDDKLARNAAEDYLAIISMHLANNNIAPTTGALLAGYHSGMGNVVKGNIGEKGLDYLSKARALMGDFI